MSEVNLQRLIGEPSSEEEYVPGEGAALPKPAAHESDWNELTLRLFETAKTQDSALAKSRTLAVAGVLLGKQRRHDLALEALQQAASTSPKVSLAAQLYARHASAEQEREQLERALESAARAAQHPASRLFAQLALKELWLRTEQPQKVVAQLDQLARSGQANPALILERAARRLAAAQSLAGIEFSSELESHIRTSWEVLLGHSSDGEAVANQDLALLRASRCLERSDLDGALSALQNAGLPETLVQELEVSLKSAIAPHEAVKSAQRLAEANPTRENIRRFAFLALDTGDADALGAALSLADPAAGTFQLTERLFLSSVAGATPRAAKEEVLATLERNVIVGLSLASPLTPCLDPSDASEAHLMLQLGALARLRGVSNAAAIAEVDDVDELYEATLAEVEQRGSAPKVVAALRLFDARKRGDAAAVVAHLERLSLAADTQVFEFMRLLFAQSAGVLEEEVQAGLHELAEQSEHPAQLAAAHALGVRLSEPSLGSTSTAQLLATLDAFESQRSDQSSAAQSLRQLLRLRSAESARASSRGEFSNESQSSDTQSEDQELSAPALPATWLQALSYTSYLKSDASAASAAEKTISASSDIFGQLLSVLQLLDSSQQVESLSEGTLRHPDPALRAISLFRRAAFGQNAQWQQRLDALGTRASTVDQAPQTATPIAEALWHYARAALEQDRTTTASLRAELVQNPTAPKATLRDVDEYHASQGDTLALQRATDYWADLTKSAEQHETQLFAYERLAELDERSGNLESALLWQRALAEQFPQHIPSALNLEESQRALGKSPRATLERLAQLLPPGDREAYQLFLGSEALAVSDLRATHKQLSALFEQADCPSFVIRALAVVAREKRDDQLLLACYLRLAERAVSDLDRVATALEVAFAACRLGNMELAQHWGDKALSERPTAIAVLQLRSFLQTSQDPVEQAELLSALAASASYPKHQAALYLEAAAAWMVAEDHGQAATCYEKNLELTPTSKEALEALLPIRREQKDWAAVERLLLLRLSQVKAGSREQLERELELADILSAQQNPQGAKARLENALASHPENTQALRAHAEVSAMLGAHQSAERSLVALRDRLPDGPERHDVVRALARIYFEHLGQLEKAMDAYETVLRAQPDDVATQERLVEVYCRLRLAERATAMQTQLIQNAAAAEQKREGAIKLAQIYEEIANDTTRAGATLERARKAWPLDASLLEATILFMDRNLPGSPRGFIIDRAGKDARRKLDEGRIDQAMLETLAKVAELSGSPAEAEACAAARLSYLGEEGALSAAGLHCLSTKLENYLAPRGFSEPLRKLLRKTGPAMDAAFSVDVSALGARPLREGEIVERVQKMAEAIQWPSIEVLVSDKLGARCLPVSSHPPRLLIGTQLERVPGLARDYLLMRALKLQQMGAGALARSRDEDRWPLLVALLHLFAPNWRPPSVDGKKAAQARALLEQGLARMGYDEDVPTLALEAIGALGNQTEGLGDAPRLLANRAGLIGVGALSAVLEAIAAGEGKTLSASGPSRFRWIEQHAEARELVLFMTSTQFAEARIALGLAQAPEKRPPQAPGAPQMSRGPAPPQMSRGPTPPQMSRAPAPPQMSRAPALPDRGTPSMPGRPKPPPPKR